MSNNPGKLARFWQELKRRKVIYVITVYASAAFVMIELVNNVVEPLNLPPSLPTIIIIALVIGFPIAIIMSWIFDITPKGMASNTYVGFFELAVRYNLLNQNDRVLDFFEVGLEMHDPNMPYITTGFFDTETLEDDPRFLAILERMNLSF